MRTKLLAFVSLFMLALTVFAINFGVGAVTYTDIASATDWNNLASQEKVSGNYRLTASISVTTTIKSFSGTFEGGGKTITFSNSDGTISGSSGTFGGVFREVTGTTTINNLKTMLGKTTSVTYFGGVVGQTASKSNVTITKCTFDTYYYNALGSIGSGGIVGVSYGNILIKDCDVSINSSNYIKGGFVGGILGRANSYAAKIVGCSVKGNKVAGIDSSGAIALGGIIGYSDSSDSILYKNLVKLDNFGLTYPGNGSISCQGAGFLAGKFNGYASGNFAYIKNITDYVAYTAYFVGTCSTYASIFNNACETNNSSISKEFYSSAPSCAGRNYTAKGLSAIQTTSTYNINPIDDCYGSTYTTIDFKGPIYILLNFAINVGCADLLYSGSGERYFNSSLDFKSGTSTDGSSYHKSCLYFYLDSDYTEFWKSTISIQGNTLTLSDFGTPTKNHYTFYCWKEIKNNSTSTVTTHTMSSNYDANYIDRIYAYWTAAKKTFYFDVDGVAYKNREATYNSAMNLSSTTSTLNIPNPTKQNYEFVRWEYINGNKTYASNSSNYITKEDVNALFDINSEIRFNAVFNKVGEKVSVNLNGGTLNSSFATTLTKDSAYSIPSQAPAKAGYEFINYTVTNGTKTLTVANGGTISVADVNEFISTNATVTITANYNSNELIINYSNLLSATSLNSASINYDGQYVFPEYPYSTVTRYFGGYKVIYNNQEYTFKPGDSLPEEIIHELISDSSNTLNVSIIWINKIQYDESISLNSLDKDGFEFSNDASIVEANKNYNGSHYSSGIKINDGDSFTYNSDDYYNATFVANEDNASLTINGVEYVAENGIINAKINSGENTFVANGDVVLVYSGFRILETSIDIKCQYDTLNPASATKIRFIAIIDNIDPEELSSGSFFISVDNIEKEFKISKVYSSINVLDDNYTGLTGRYYAVYTIYGIEDAISQKREIDSIRFELQSGENTISFERDGFVLGA